MTGRPTDYTDQAATEICERLRMGETLGQICADKGMPVERTVYRWLHVHDAFSQNYARAREESAHKSADKVQEIAADVEAGTLEADKARVAIDAHKWIAGKRKPKVYGDRTIHDVGDETLKQMSDERLNSRLAQLIGKARINLDLGGKGEAGE